MNRALLTIGVLVGLASGADAAILKVVSVADLTPYATGDAAVLSPAAPDPCGVVTTWPGRLQGGTLYVQGMPAQAQGTSLILDTYLPNAVSKTWRGNWTTTAPGGIAYDPAVYPMVDDGPVPNP